MAKVIPAILTNSPVEAKELLRVAEDAGLDRVQIDIIDGVFAENKTIDPSVFESVETSLKLDFHLMVKEPISWVERCIKAGADRIIGQIEMMASQEKFVGKVQEVGAYVGLAIDLPTSVEALDEVIINSVDAVLVMSVKAGFGGQEFDDSALKKIKVLDNIRSRDTSPFSIIDDGGITLNTIDDAKRSGADEIVIGRRLFEGDLKENMEKFLKASYK